VAVGVNVPLPCASAYRPVPPVTTSVTDTWAVSVSPWVVTVPLASWKSTSHCFTPGPAVVTTWQLAEVPPVTLPDTMWLATRNWSPADGPTWPRSRGVNESIAFVNDRVHLAGPGDAEALLTADPMSSPAAPMIPTDAATRLEIMVYLFLVWFRRRDVRRRAHSPSAAGPGACVETADLTTRAAILVR